MNSLSSIAGRTRPSRTLARWTGLVGVSVLLAGLLLAAVAVAVVPGSSPVSASCGSACGSAGDWTMFHNSATHLGYNSSETTLTASNVPFLTSAWTAATTSAGVYSSPAVANGVVYVGTRDDNLYAFAVGCNSGGGTCTPLWTGATGGAIDSSPAVANGVVYVGSADHKLYAFAVGCNSGGGACTPLWTASTGFNILSSPTVAGGVVYIGSQDASLYAFDAAGVTRCSGVAPARTCLPLWTGPTGNAIDGSAPAVSGGVVYIASQDGKLYAFGVGCASGGGTCTPIWTGATGSSITNSSPAVAGGVVYIGSNDHKLWAFAVGCASGGGTCTPVWTGATGGSLQSSPAVANNVVYVGSLDGKLWAFAVGCASGGGTCSPVWTGDTTSGIESSPAVANGVVYIGAGNSKVYAFAVGCASGGAACSSIWTGTTSGGVFASPAVANGVVYAGDTDGNLHAFDLVVDHLTLSPAGATITAGASQPYAAEAFDVLNHDLGDFTGSTTFTYDSAGGCSANSCSPTIAGDHTITGTNGTATGATTLHVNAGALNHLILSPSNATITTGATQAYTAHGADAFNNDLGDATGSTTFTIDLGTPCPADTCTGAFPASHLVTGTDGAITGTTTLTVVGDTYNPVPPVRLLDTRVANGLSGKFSGGVPRTFQVSGRGGVPVGATAVTANVTVVKPSLAASVYLGPDPIAHPSTSTINFNAGDITAYGSTIALDGAGEMSATLMAASGTTDLVLDVTGYFIPDLTGDTYHPLTPARLLDTRTGNGLSGKFLTGVPRTFLVWGRGGVPSGAKAVTGNLTVVNSTHSWAAYIGPDPIANPLASTINFAKGQIRANSLTVALSTAGKLSATFLSSAHNSTNLVFDVTGYYTADLTGTRYVPLTPVALVDTRIGTGLAGKFSANSPRTFTVRGTGGVPTGATGVSGIVSVFNESSSWATFVGPVATPKPTTSALNFLKGDNCSNGVTVALSPSGALSITYMGPAGATTNIVFIVTGYFVP